MKKFLAILLAASTALGQTNVQKGSGNVLSNGSIVVGNNTSITTSGNGTIAATSATNLPSGTTQDGIIIATAITDPVNPPAGKGYIFFDSTHNNYNAKNNAGVTLNMVNPNTVVTNQFVTSIGRNGTITTAQPTLSNISGFGSGWPTTLAAATGTTGQVLASNGTSYVPTTLAPSTSIFGTANQIVASAATGNVTLSLSPTAILPGTLTLNGTNSITLGGGGAGGATIAATGNLTTSNLIITAPSSGTAQIVAGTATVGFINAGANIPQIKSTSANAIFLSNTAVDYAFTNTDFRVQSSDGTINLGQSGLRWGGIFLAGKARFGNGTAGGSIYPRGTSPNESLVIRGVETYTYNQTMDGVIDVQDLLVINTARTTNPAQAVLLENSGPILKVSTANRFGYAAFEAATITGAGNVTSSGGSLISVRPGIAATSTDGALLSNTTAAAVGAQQYSPRLRFSGYGWKTNATAASQQVEFIEELRPVQGAANPTGLLAWASQINGTGGFVDKMTLGSDGNLSIGGTTFGFLTASNSNQIVFHSGGGQALSLGGSVPGASGIISANGAFTAYNSGTPSLKLAFAPQGVGTVAKSSVIFDGDVSLSRDSATALSVRAAATSGAALADLTVATITPTTIQTPGGQPWNGSFSGNLIGTTWFDGTTWKFGNTATLNWTPSSPAGATPDLGLARASAGVLKVTDGGSGGGNITFGGNAAEIYRSGTAQTGYTLIRDNNNVGYAALKLVSGGSGTNKTFELTPYSQHGAWTFRGLAIDNAESQGYHETVNLPFILGATTYQSTSRPAWGTSGSRFRVTAATNTDSSTLASGTATTAVANSFGIPTFAAANTAVTTTNAATVYIDGAPAAGTNMTITNPYSLWVAAGRSRFDNDIRVGLSSDTDTKAIDFYNTASGVSRYRIEQSNGALLFKDYQNTTIVQMLTQGQGLTMTGGLQFSSTFTDPGTNIWVAYRDATYGLVARGTGSTTDVTLANRNNVRVLGIAGNSQSLRHFGAEITAASTDNPAVVYQSDLRTTTYAVSFNAAQITKPAATTSDIVIATLPAKTRLTKIVVDSTTAWTGTSITAVTWQVGKTTGGSEYIVAFNALAAPVTKGLADADLGTSINRANAVQGGDLPSWTATTPISARITSTGANLSALTTGNITFYLTCERY